MEKMSEGYHQAKLVEWAKWNVGTYPELNWVFHIPNGGHRHIIEAMKLKRQGVKPGVFDICLPVARRCHHGCYIELKYGKNKLTKEQHDFLDFIENEGYIARIFYDWKEAADFIEWYLKGQPWIYKGEEQV